MKCLRPFFSFLTYFVSFTFYISHSLRWDIISCLGFVCLGQGDRKTQIQMDKIHIPTPTMGNSFYYIPINVIILDIVDFTECEPMLRITTQFFWIHLTPLWNWWRSTQCFFQYIMLEALCHHSYRNIQNMYPVLYLFQNETYKSCS